MGIFEFEFTFPFIIVNTYSQIVNQTVHAGLQFAYDALWARQKPVP